MTDPLFQSLSARQRECLRLVGRNYTTKEIAVELRISPETARDHIDAARGRLGADTRAKAARMLVEYEANQTPPQTGSPPPMGIAAALLPPHQGPISSTTLDKTRTALNDAAVPAYQATSQPTSRRRWPIRTESRTVNDFAWYEQIAWAVAIAVGAIVAIHEIASLLRG